MDNILDLHLQYHLIRHFRRLEGVKKNYWDMAKTFVDEIERRRVTPEHYLKSEEEMIELFKDLPEATLNTVEIAKRLASAEGTYLYSVISNLDATTFQQHTQRTFEHLLTHSRNFVHSFGCCIIIYRQFAIVVAKQCQQFIRRIAHLLQTLLLQAQIDTCIGRDAADICLCSLANTHRAEELILINHTPMAIIYNHAIADRRLRSDQNLNLLTR